MIEIKLSEKEKQAVRDTLAFRSLEMRIAVTKLKIEILKAIKAGRMLQEAINTVVQSYDIELSKMEKLKNDPALFLKKYFE